MTEASEYYRDKVAVVTGGASGVGLALCETMLGYGARRVVIGDFNDENLNRETARLEASHPGQVLGVHCDVTDEAQVQQLIARAAEFGDGHVDFLFNNAGAGFAGYFDKLTNDDWRRAFDLNFYSAIYGVRAVLPVMRAQGGGHIVNIISGIAWAPMSQQSMYASTKAALNMFGLVLRYELWDEKIRVSSATPGTTITAIWGDSAPPPGAQTAEQSAHRVLEGVARNDRIVMGDDRDLEGSRHVFDADAAEGIDDYFINVARQRAKGILAL